MIPDFSIAAELDVEVDGEKDKKAKEQALAEWTKPRVLRVPFSTGPMAGTPSFADCIVGSGPNQRRKWNVKRIAGGAPITLSNIVNTTNVGAQLFLFKYTGQLTGNLASDAGILSSADLLYTQSIWNGSTAQISLAFFETFGYDECTIFYPEQLVFAILTFGSAGLAGTPVIGNVQVVDEPR